MATKTLDIRTLDPERRIGVQQVSELGFGHPVTVRELMTSGAIPAVKVGGVWKVRVGDLPGARNLSASAPSPSPSVDLDELATLAARVVSTWPRLTAERKAELSRLLAAA